MTEQEAVNIAAVAASKQKSLELLFDYTKFHIGVYLTLTASYLTAATAQINGKAVLSVDRRLLRPAIACFLIAGLSGGVIASSLTQVANIGSSEFLNLPIGPWDWKAIQFPARYWTYLEHSSFWIGILCAVPSFRPATPATVKGDIHKLELDLG